MGEEAARTIQGCVMLCVASTGGVRVSPPPAPLPPKHLGGNVVSLQEKRGEAQHPQRLPSDSEVTASGLGEWQITGAKFHWGGGSLSLFTDKRRGSQKTRHVSNRTPKAAPDGLCFF